MGAQPLAIVSTGLMTSVGLTAPAACAAIRCALTNPSETRFLNRDGERIFVHAVPRWEDLRGRPKLVLMAVEVIRECLRNVAEDEWARIPLLLCVAEHLRPGRTDGLDDRLFSEIQDAMRVSFSADSLIVPGGRVGIAVAALQARRLIAERRASRVLVAAVDSLITWPTLSAYEQQERLLTGETMNGFIPGEGAGAVLLGDATGEEQFVCTGIGTAMEPSTLESGEPLRGIGLSKAIRSALVEAGREMHDLSFRIADLSGEQYYFKEAALALARTLRKPKESFDLWHPAECIGETGATAGLAMLAVAEAACRKGYAPGSRILMHLAADDGQRAALTLEFGPN
jgi:3-oxoacyl-[acyl-carrier-protein] synthase-1